MPLGNRQAFTPSVHVSADGTVGVTYFDFRNNVAGDAELSTDFFIVHCHPSPGVSCTDPAHWRNDAAGGETRLTRTSFNLRNAPVARGFFLGDYMGLSAAGNVFRPVFVVAGSTAGTSSAVTAGAGP